MQINYLILTHNQPLQLKRLISALQARQVSFYVHIDKKTDIGPFKDALSEFENVVLLEDKARVDVVWGDMSIVQATLNILQQIPLSGKGYCVLLSGQDYPIKSTAYISGYLQENYGADFISINPLPFASWPNSGMDRITKYKVNFSNKQFDYYLLPSVFEKEFYSAATWKVVRKILLTSKGGVLSKLLKRRKVPGNSKVYGGHAWWAFTNETVGAILGYLKSNPTLLSYFEDSLLPDEMIFQTVFMALPVVSNSAVIKAELTYVNWDKPNVTLPVTFTHEDFDELNAHPDKLFARKFSYAVDTKIFDLIDQRILNKG
ncbi:MAG TPA: beta-1,6-N-acetylglucosaminyltransferase [Chitinophagales bacterium]|nr:beta-1,6-N-acetylglucosaminyltransferase [Chitinophagales bacterium]